MIVKDTNTHARVINRKWNYINAYICIMMRRISEEIIAKTSSQINLRTQNCLFSGEQLASPSAELNRACITSPPKFWHSLSNIWHQTKH